MSVKVQPPNLTDLRPRITVLGVGGAGGNAVNNMIASGLSGVQFMVANTDAQALAVSAAQNRIQLGVKLTEGFGAGSKPEIGQAAAEEAIDEIRARLSGSHMVFIAAGMGGGTGTGAAGVIARVARELGALTVAVVTKPFQFEGTRRMRIAEAGIGELKKYVDTLIVIPNQNLFRVATGKTTFAEAFVLADRVLYSGVACIADLIVKDGLINLDFADVRTVLSGMGTAVIGTGEASGERRASVAAEEAMSNPLLEDVSLNGAKGLLLSILGGRDLTLYEVDEAASRVRQEVDPEANIIVGATFDESLGDRVRVAIVASGMTRRDEAWLGTGAAQATLPPGVRGPTRPTLQPPYPEDVSTQPVGRPAASAPRHSARGQSGDFMGPLSKAIRPQPSSFAGADGRKPRGAWRAPGNVVIEEGLPQFAQGSAPPPPKRAADAPYHASESFMPAAPVEIARSGRRMPTVDDFPAVGQREYRARMVAAANQGAPGASLPPVHTAHPEQPRKRGLFERVAGLGRRGEQEVPANRPSFPHTTDTTAERAPSSVPPGGQQPGPDDSPQTLPPAEAEPETPIFLNREAKG